MKRKYKKQKINYNIKNDNNNKDSEEESGEENFLKEPSQLKEPLENIHEIHNEVNCYIMTDSIIIEGNLNHISILTNIIKTYDNLFNLKLKYNYSFNTSASNMKIDHLPCIYNNGKIIGKNEIFKFFTKTIEYNRSLELKQENNNNINQIECNLLKKMIINDFQILINYINYHKKNKNFLGNSLRFIIQPYKKLNGLWVDMKEIKAIEKQYNILTKREAIDKIKQINENVDEYISNNYDINNLIFINDFLILIYTFYKTQVQFFTVDKIKKYGLNTYQNIKELIRIIDDGLNKKIYEGHLISFRPEIFFNDINFGNYGGEKSGNNNKYSNAVVNKEKYMKQPVPEENTNFRLTNKLILQGIGYASFFGFMYYLKNKII